VSPGNFDGRVLHRVRLGPLASVEVADSLLDRLIRSGYTSARLIVETN
jgi:rare lipoprotein A